MRLAALTALCLFAPALGAADKAGVRPLDLGSLKLKHAGNAPEAFAAGSAEDLAKLKPLAGNADLGALAKQVDFTKEKVVVFAWQGSGGDKFAPDVKTDGGKVLAVFTYSPGVTDDLRRHGFAFAVPKDAAVEVKK